MVKVAEQMEYLNDRYGRDFFWFADDTFNVDRGRLEELCREIESRGLDVRWFYAGRVDYLLKHRDLLARMRRDGNVWVQLGVESPNDRNLAYLRKGLTVQQIMKAFRLLREHDIFSMAMFIIGLRTDTAESIRRTVKFARRLDPDFAIFTLLTPFPGSDLYEEALEKGWITTQDYSKYDMAHAIMPTETLGVKELQRLYYECYRSFYLSPLRIVRGCLFGNEWKRRVWRFMVKLHLKRVLSTLL